MSSHSLEIEQEAMERGLIALSGVTLLRNVMNTSAGQAIVRLLTILTAPEADALAAASAYSEAFYLLAAAINADAHLAILPDAWQSYLVNHILDDVNPLSVQAERLRGHRISPTLVEQARRDLRALQHFFRLSADYLLQYHHALMSATRHELLDAWVPWNELATYDDIAHITPSRAALCHQFVQSADWASLAEPLIHYWARFGTGDIARYRVLRWHGYNKNLQGIAHPDPVALASLVTYDREQHILKTNIERFLAGSPAHDVVLYGPPGTGKSSTIKALANEYAERGLRLVEVFKEDLRDLPAIAAQLRDRAPYFLLFVDDLSFEEHETQYKALKVLLEGTTEARPANLLIHVTTNRLNLIRENFADRGKPTEDVHWRDTMDEKASLVARFGLRVTFLSPDQQQYLVIVTLLARQRGLQIPEEELQTRALIWERQHAGRTGRTARQFIDDLQGELGASSGL